MRSGNGCRSVVLVTGLAMILPSFYVFWAGRRGSPPAASGGRGVPGPPAPPGMPANDEAARPACLEAWVRLRSYRGCPVLAAARGFRLGLPCDALGNSYGALVLAGPFPGLAYIADQPLPLGTWVHVAGCVPGPDPRPGPVRRTPFLALGAADVTAGRLTTRGAPLPLGYDPWEKARTRTRSAPLSCRRESLRILRGLPQEPHPSPRSRPVVTPAAPLPPTPSMPMPSPTPVAPPCPVIPAMPTPETHPMPTIPVAPPALPTPVLMPTTSAPLADSSSRPPAMPLTQASPSTFTTPSGSAFTPGSTVPVPNPCPTPPPGPPAPPAVAAAVPWPKTPGPTVPAPPPVPMPPPAPAPPGAIDGEVGAWRLSRAWRSLNEIVAEQGTPVRLSPLRPSPPPAAPLASAAPPPAGASAWRWGAAGVLAAAAVLAAGAILRSLSTGVSVARKPAEKEAPR